MSVLAKKKLARKAPCIRHASARRNASMVIILSIIIIILFKERINDYLEKKLGKYLENWSKYCNFFRARNFLKNFENFIFQTLNHRDMAIS